MKKRVLSILLAAFILCSATVTAFAAAPGLANFTKVNTYTDSTFSDVGDAWYAGNVKASYELGLFLGNGDGTFGPNSKMNIAQTITVACRLHSIYSGNGSSFETTNPWYDAYVTYAEENGIIKEGEFPNLNKNATRAQFAYILANSLPESALNAINSVGYNDIPDVFGTEYYADEVLRLYNAGIIIGSDQYGTFAPDSEIDRTAVAAIATRMADTALRLKADFSENFKTFSTDYFTVKVPTWLLEICTVEADSNRLTFRSTCCMDTYGGMAFSIEVEDEFWDFGVQQGGISYENGDWLYVNNYYPGDVQWDYTNDECTAKYEQIAAMEEAIMKTFTPLEGKFITYGEHIHWKDTYNKLLNTFISYNMDAEDYGSYYKYESYTLSDIDNDSCPELFMLYGSCEADYEWFVYKFNSITGSFDSLGTVPGYHSGIAGVDGECAFYRVMTVQGAQTITKYSLVNGILKEKVMYSGSEDYSLNIKYCPTYDIASRSYLNGWSGDNESGNRLAVEKIAG